MTELKFTPGPWEIYRLTPHGLNQHGDCLVEAQGNTIALALYLGGTEQAKANAHLIAAAPDLYAALERFVNAAESWHNFHNHTDIQCDSLCACIGRGKSALAKVRGEGPEP